MFRRLLFRQNFLLVPGSTLYECYVVVCDACVCVFADGIPTQAEFDAYYRDLSKYETQDRAGQETEHDLARYKDDADFIVDHFTERSARVLDIGCASGGMLAELKRR